MITAITGTCGHTYDKKVLTFNGEEPASQGAATRLANKAIKYWSTRICLACYKSDREVDQATTLSMLPPLAGLQGSERQVAWATKVRAQRLTALIDLDSRASSANLGSMDDHAHRTGGCDWCVRYTFIVAKNILGIGSIWDVTDLLARITEAKFWIDTKDEELQLFLGDKTHAYHVKYDFAKQTVVLAKRARKVLIGYARRNEWGEGYKWVGGTKYHDKVVAVS